MTTGGLRKSIESINLNEYIVNNQIKSWRSPFKLVNYWLSSKTVVSRPKTQSFPTKSRKIVRSDESVIGFSLAFALIISYVYSKLECLWIYLFELDHPLHGTPSSLLSWDCHQRRVSGSQHQRYHSLYFRVRSLRSSLLMSQSINPGKSGDQAIET